MYKTTNLQLGAMGVNFYISSHIIDFSDTELMIEKDQQLNTV